MHDTQRYIETLKASGVSHETAVAHNNALKEVIKEDLITTEWLAKKFEKQNERMDREFGEPILAKLDTMEDKMAAFSISIRQDFNELKSEVNVVKWISGITGALVILTFSLGAFTTIIAEYLVSLN